jgi:hypothetical protein
MNMKACAAHIEVTSRRRTEPYAHAERGSAVVVRASKPPADFPDLLLSDAIDLDDSNKDRSRAHVCLRTDIKHTTSTLCGPKACLLRLFLRRWICLFKTGTNSLIAVVAISTHSEATAQDFLEARPGIARRASRDLPNNYSTTFQLDDRGALNSHRLNSAPLSSSTSASTVNDAKGITDDGDDDDDRDDENEEEEDDEDQVTPIIEELFLGKIVYPQEKDEVQLTFGYFDGVEATANSETIFEIEYGITDRFQIGFEVPIESAEEEEPFEGVRNLNFELYYNFYNERSTGRAYGIGCEFGVPIDAAAGESRAYVYEPFFIAYQEYGDYALNLSAALEIEDPLAVEATETVGDVAFGIIGKAENIVPLLELRVEIASDETPVLLAPGFYAKSFIKPFDVAVSFPIGLNDDAPDFAVFFLAVVEFEASAIQRRFYR